MRSTRRDFLALGLGATQLALLDRFGLIRSAKAAPMTDAPTKFLMLYLAGGTRQHYQWWPQNDADVDRAVPATAGYAFFSAKDLTTLGPQNGEFSPLRMPRRWNPSDVSDGSGHDSNGGWYTPLGYVWASPDYRLWENTSVLHGINQGTNSHASGYVSCMCGVAGQDYRAPAIHSVISNFFYEKFKDTRPLPCVAIDSAGMPNSFTLPQQSAAVLVPSADQLNETLSADPARSWWWKNLDARHDQPELTIDGKPTGSTIRLTDLEAAVLDGTRPFHGRSTPGTDHFLDQLYGGYAGLSKVLARDVVSVLEKTKGMEYIGVPSYLKDAAWGTLGFAYPAAGSYINDGAAKPLDMALRLLKSDLATTVHARLPDPFWDTHSPMGQFSNSMLQRGTFDVLGRFLAEMKATSAKGGPAKSGEKTLLDDTLVLITSEFSRTWAQGESQSKAEGWQMGDDHWPYMTVTLAGGGVAPNRSIGQYILPDGSGADVDILDEGGNKVRRPPSSGDLMATIARIYGLEFGKPKDPRVPGFFVPGGYGEVVGLRKI